MAGKRVQYQIVGRYLNGTEVTGYHLQSIDTGKAGKYTREQVCYLVGRDQVTNCTGQIYQDKVLLRGKGISLEDLPAVNEKGNTKNMDKVPKKSTVEQAIERFRIVGSLKDGRNTVGYVIQNAGGGTAKITRDQTIELISQGKIANARVQNYNGKVLIRGVGCSLDELPSQQINGQAGNKRTPAANKTAESKPTASKSATSTNSEERVPFRLKEIVLTISNELKKRGHTVTAVNKVSGDGKTKLWAEILYDQCELDVMLDNGHIRSTCEDDNGHEIFVRDGKYTTPAEMKQAIIDVVNAA